jgi:ribonuclease BN (tRNA processing enzyme)
MLYRHALSPIGAGAVIALLFSSVANAQTRPTALPRANNRTEILFLGTSGGPPLYLNRSKPATLLIVDGREYLIDCGLGTMQRMLEADIKSEDVRTIFLTHLHSDHDLGLADVLGNDFFRMGFAGAEHPVSVYGPLQTKELVNAAFHYIAVSVRPFIADQMPAAYRSVKGEAVSPFVAHEIQREGVIFQDDKVRVTAIENSHYALMPVKDRSRLKSYSYRIETPHGVVLFTGDTGPSDAVTHLAQGADVLVAEASSRDPADAERFVNASAARNHWSSERAARFRDHFKSEHLDANTVGKLAMAAHVKAVVLYHYDPNDKADQAAYVSSVRKAFSGPVFAPDDLDRYCIPDAGNVAVLGACGQAFAPVSHASKPN